MKRHIPVEKRKGLYWSENKTGKVYEVRYTEDGKSRFKVVGPNLKEAIAVQAEINVKLGKGYKVTYPNMSFGKVAEEWKQARQERWSPGTYRKYDGNLKRYLLPEFGAKQVKSISTDQIALFLSRLRRRDGRPMSGTYAQGIYITLYGVMDYAANSRRNYIPRNPCVSLEAGERPKLDNSEKRAMTEQEVQALKAASAEWFRPLLITALTTGMRPSEVLGLRWDAIDFDTNTVHVWWQLEKVTRKYIPTKGRERRDVPLVPDLRTALMGLPTRFRGEHLFTQPDGGQATYDGLQRAFQAARDKAGIDPKLGMHACRHTYASALLRNGEDIAWVSSLLGHKSPKVTLGTYLHVIQRDNRTEEATLRLAEALGDLG